MPRIPRPNDLKLRKEEYDALDWLREQHRDMYPIQTFRRILWNAAEDAGYDPTSKKGEGGSGNNGEGCGQEPVSHLGVGADTQSGPQSDKGS